MITDIPNKLLNCFFRFLMLTNDKNTKKNAKLFSSFTCLQKRKPRNLPINITLGTHESNMFLNRNRKIDLKQKFRKKPFTAISSFQNNIFQNVLVHFNKILLKYIK